MNECPVEKVLLTYGSIENILLLYHITHSSLSKTSEDQNLSGFRSADREGLIDSECTLSKPFS